MKLLPFFLLFFVVQLNAQLSKTEKILTNGTWLIFRENDKYLNDNNLAKVIFKKDKSAEIIKLQKAKTTNGSWELSKDQKKLILGKKNYPGQEFKILSVDAQKLILSKDGSLTEFKKIPANYELPKNEYPTKIVGSWKIQIQNGQDVSKEEKYLQFDSEGNAIASFMVEKAKWWTRGEFLYLDPGNQAVFKFSISKDENKLTFINENEKNELVRSDKKISSLEPVQNPSDINSDENNIVLSKENLIGIWEIEQSNEDLLLNIVFAEDGSYTELKNGAVMRNGQWEISSNLLLLIDAENNNTNYLISPLQKGSIKLSSEKKEMILKKSLN